MELRSKTKSIKRSEFRYLENILSGMGFYEAGMELEEMRELVSALEASMWQNETGTPERDELLAGFKQTEVHNSTMLSPHMAVPLKEKSVSMKNGFYNGNASSPFSSPEMPSEQLTIQAEVYHSHDWSPRPTIPPAPPTSPCCNRSMKQKQSAVDALELKRLQLKRLFVDAVAEHEESIIEIIEDKRPCLASETFSICVSSESNDSGANMSQCAASSADADDINLTDFSQDYNVADDSNDADWLP